MKKIVFLVFFISGISICSYSQELLQISLKKALSIAKSNSLDYKIATNSNQASYWNFQSYKSRFLPKLTLNGTIPEYYRTVNMITLPNGQNNFVNQNVANSSLNLNLAQNVGLTGGNVSISSSLKRLQNFGTFENKAYSSVPLTLSYNQTNLLYNDFKWQKKIEPLKLQEAQRSYQESLENISYNTIDKYFDLLKDDIQLKLDQQNLKNIDTLLKISKERFKISTVQLNDVLQTQVSYLNAKKSVANSLLTLKTAQQNLIRFLGLDKNLNIELRLPDSVSFFEIDPAVALQKAKSNRKFLIEFQRRLIEAEQFVARTKSEASPSVFLRANLGLSQTGDFINQAYTDLLRNQSVSVGFSVPLEDWGVNKSNRKRAEANLELEKNYISQQELSIEQEITYQVLKWNLQKDQIVIANETSELAQKRYNISKQRYLAGNVSYTDFNNSQLEKDRAVIDYVIALRNYWSLYYLIRKITLFDFEKNEAIRQ